MFVVARARKLAFALKVIEATKVRGQEEAIESEVAILRRLKNRNVVQLIEEFHTPAATFLVMELVTVRRHTHTHNLAVRYRPLASAI